MTSILALTLTLLVVMNPAGLLLRWKALLSGGQAWVSTIAMAVTIVALVGAALLGDEILELLETPEATFQVGAGLLLLVDAIRTVLQREPFNPERYGPGGNQRLIAGVRMVLSTATPATLALAVFYGAGRGEGDTIAAVAIAGLLSTLALFSGAIYELTPWRAPLRELGRATAAVLAVLAVDLIIDGVIAV